MEFITLDDVSNLPKTKQEIVLGFIPENEKELDGALSDLLTCDPDYLKLGNDKVAFVENKGIVVTEEDLTDTQKLVLTNFFDKEVKGIISIEDTWIAFNNAKNAIAYRGGIGYYYSIWQVII